MKRGSVLVPAGLVLPVGKTGADGRPQLKVGLVLQTTLVDRTRSAVKRLDVAVYDIVRSVVRGTLTTGGNSVFDLRNHGVGLGKVRSKVPRRFLGELDRLRAQIVAGKIRVASRLSR